MLNFCRKFGIFCFLDNHDYNFDKSIEWVAGAGAVDKFLAGDGVNFADLDLLIQSNPDWIFGHVSYDFKNQIENLNSSNPDGIGFPQFLFFIPEIIFIFKGKELSIGVYPNHNPKQIFYEIISFVPEKLNQTKPVIFQSRFTKEEYIETVKKL
ncbi:MAG: aminodeoxychorismate synthase component I, partial [Ginsengibacter sp.]